MWPHPGGHVGPPTHRSLYGDLRRRQSRTLVLSVRAPTQILGPQNFDQISMMPETNIFQRRPSLISPLLEFQPLVQMPLDSHISQRARTYRRIQYEYRTRRPFTLFNHNRRDEPRLRRPIFPLLDAEIQSGNSDTLSVDSSESLSITHWARYCQQSNDHQFSCQWNETPTLSSNFYMQNHNESSLRDVTETVSLNDSTYSDSAMTTISSESIELNVEELRFDRRFNVPVLVSSASFSTANEPTSELPFGDLDCPVSLPDHSYSFESSEDKDNSSFTNDYFDDLDDNNSRYISTPSISSDWSHAENDHNMGSGTLMPVRTLSIPMMPQPSALARHVANRVIKHAHDISYPNERELWCLSCGLFPRHPVTGQCGHTRCIRCIEVNGSCPCGAQAPENLHVNILVKDLIGKILRNNPPVRTVVSASTSVDHNESPEPYYLPSTSASGNREWQGPERHRRSARSLYYSPISEGSSTTLRYQPISVQGRFKYALELLSVGRLREAAPHLAHVAASSEATARMARTLLAQAVATLSQTRDPRRITRELYRLVRLQAGTSWLKESDLECILCYHTFINPVTTPCGHTYCRACIERSLGYRKTCALCLRSLDHFNLAATRDTSFVCAALASVNTLSLPSPPDPDVIPIFACTAAYPSIPCQLFIFNPSYWLMIRRVLESGSRKFGMVAYERDRSYSDYGTILEVCDCVQFEDGRSILSTVGVSRFRVIERDVREGCVVARIEPLMDLRPTQIEIWDLNLMAHLISDKAVLWLSSLNKAVVSDIVTAFGQIPRFQLLEENWWETADGPDWLWWLIAILPLRSEIQVLMLSTKQLLKRMMAVSRTLEAVCKL